MKLVHLKELAQISAGQGAPKNPSDFSNEGIPFVRAGSLDRLLEGDEEDSLELVPKSTADKYRLKLYPAGSVIFAKSGMSATKDRVYSLKEPAYVVNHLAIVVPHNDADSSYLTYALRRFKPSSLINDKAYPSINLPAIEGHKVFVPYKNGKPDLNEQIQIATLLGRIDALIATRKNNLQQLDDFLRSIFLEMFGDPVNNSKKWDSPTLEQYCSNIVDCPHSTPKYVDFDTGYFCIRSSDIVDGALDLSITRFVEKDTYQERIARHEPTEGDVAYTREGGRLGNAAIILADKNICLGQRMMLFTTDSKESFGRFLWAILESYSFKKKIMGLIGGGAAPRVNIKDLKKLKIISPPNDMQKKFSSLVENIENLKVKYKSNLLQLDNLYGVLSQKAFKGELDLSRVPLPESEFFDLPTEETASETPTPFSERIQLIDEYPMNFSENRKKYMCAHLDALLKEGKGNKFTLESLWKEMSWKLVDSMDEECLPLSVDDYDIARDWLYSLIKKGKVEQTFEEDTNQMVLMAKV